MNDSEAFVMGKATLKVLGDGQPSSLAEEVTTCH